MTWVHVCVRVRLGLYSRVTWLHAPGRVCTGPFVPVWACTPRKPGFTPPEVYARARSSPFGPVQSGKPGCTPLDVRTRARSCRFWPCTPGKPGCTPLRECARPRTCQFGSVPPQYLALRLLTSMHVPVRASLGLYARKPGCTPLRCVLLLLLLYNLHYRRVTR